VITRRELRREEIALVWTIDRRETIDNIYVVENGALVMRPHRIDVRGWPPGEAEKYTPILLECFDRGGWFHGAFDGGKLVGAVVLDAKRIGRGKDQLQLEFLHVSNAYRGKGLGKRLFELARATARERGARRLYVSATPSENTVNFYRRRGCVLTREPDAELFAREPEDIHFECNV
jgi:predicted N-acetyltransferase YhbS